MECNGHSKERDCMYPGELEKILQSMYKMDIEVEMAAFNIQ